MKKLLVFVFSLVVLSTLSSCKKDRGYHSEYLKEPEVEYTHEDSSQIKNYITQFSDAMNAHNYKQVADMMAVVKDGTNMPLTYDQRQQMIRAYEMMNIEKVEWETTILRDYKNNEVTLIMYLKNPTDSLQPRETRVKLNPVCLDGKWYLTFLNKDAEGVHNIYEVNDSTEN